MIPDFMEIRSNQNFYRFSSILGVIEPFIYKLKSRSEHTVIVYLINYQNVNIL